MPKKSLRTTLVLVLVWSIFFCGLASTSLAAGAAPVPARQAKPSSTTSLPGWVEIFVKILDWIGRIITFIEIVMYVQSHVTDVGGKDGQGWVNETGVPACVIIDGIVYWN